jgi:hypothetical protein
MVIASTSDAATRQPRRAPLEPHDLTNTSSGEITARKRKMWFRFTARVEAYSNYVPPSVLLRPIDVLIL